MSSPNRPTREMPVIPTCRPTGHVCVVSGHEDGRCGHCDAGYTCPNCGHKGMQTIGPGPKEPEKQGHFWELCPQTIGPGPKEPPEEPEMPGHFLERCPSCGAKKWVPWITYDVLCPKCDEKIAFVVYSASFESVTKCPKCGVVPRDKTA